MPGKSGFRSFVTDIKRDFSTFDEFVEIKKKATALQPKKQISQQRSKSP
jgi:hypothetical protein